MKVQNRELFVKSNKSKRTFTLRFKYNDGSTTKYRTLPFTKEKFENAQFWTTNDWGQFLKTDEYHEVR